MRFSRVLLNPEGAQKVGTYGVFFSPLSTCLCSQLRARSTWAHLKCWTLVHISSLSWPKLPASLELGGDKVSRPARGLLFIALGAVFHSLTYLQSYSDSHFTPVRSLHLLVAARGESCLARQADRESFLLPMTSAQPSCPQCLHIPSVTLGFSYFGVFIRF